MTYQLEHHFVTIYLLIAKPLTPLVNVLLHTLLLNSRRHLYVLLAVFFIKYSLLENIFSPRKVFNVFIFLKSFTEAYILMLSKINVDI